MTIVKGKLDSLKRIRSELNQNGITRFNSLGDISSFVKDYKLEQQVVIEKIEQDLDNEMAVLQADSVKSQEYFEKLKIAETNAINNKIDYLLKRSHSVNAKSKILLVKAFKCLQFKILKFKVKRLERNFNSIIKRSTLPASIKVDESNRKLSEFLVNRGNAFSYRSLIKRRELANTKKVVDGLYPIIAGAIGENLVMKELKRLSDDNILLNDFSVDFNPPIYHRKEDDRIFSIQIDHLLITNSGIFIIETKNWSRESIRNIDMRSPIEQIKRTSYAMYVIMNGNSKHSGVNLKRHHWGEKKIPIRSLVVMIKNKPKETFRFVTVKTLEELNGYVSYFEPVFSDSEVKRISNYLETICN